LIALFPEGTYVRAHEESDSWYYVIMPNASIYKVEICGTDAPGGSVNIEIHWTTDEIAQAVIKAVGKLEGWYDD
jgi:hypothetical protein